MFFGSQMNSKTLRCVSCHISALSVVMKAMYTCQLQSTAFVCSHVDRESPGNGALLPGKPWKVLENGM